MDELKKAGQNHYRLKNVHAEVRRNLSITTTGSYEPCRGRQGSQPSHENRPDPATSRAQPPEAGEAVQGGCRGAEDDENGDLNTTNAVNSQGADAHAAKLCKDLVAYGYDDWFLPSKNELNAMYSNRFQIGGFDAGAWYWSSTQTTNGIYAYARFFGDQSSQPEVYKDKDQYYLNVRCVSRLLSPAP